VPADGNGWCYISSGTWSLMGVELDAPIINQQSLALNFTNEVGAENTIRFLKNIAGLWLLQECRRAWSLAGREYSYDDLSKLAAEAPPLFRNPAACRSESRNTAVSAVIEFPISPDR
jgi:rhamnulokinase